MSTEHTDSPLPLRRVQTPIRIRVREFLRGPVQVFIWTAMGLFAVWLSGVTQAPGQFPGVVMPVEANLGFSRDGVVAEVAVEPGEVVARGTLLGRLDDAELLARIAVAETSVATVAAELDSVARRHEMRKAERALEHRLSEENQSLDREANEVRWLDSMARLRIEAQDRRLEVVALEGELATMRLEVELVALRLTRARQLADLNVGQQAEVEDLELQEQAARQEIAAAEASLEANRAGAADLERRLEEAPPATGDTQQAPEEVGERMVFETAAQDAALAELRVIESRLDLSRAEIAALQVEAQALVLRSTIEGRVTAVEAMPGQAVLAGAVVVRVHSQDAEVITTFLAEPISPDEVLPETMSVGRASAPEVTAEARVIGHGPGVEMLPARLWAHPERPVYGRTLLLAPPADLRLVPGEEVRAELP